MASIIIPTTDALSEPTILRALRKLVAWATGNFQKIADNQEVVAIDTELSNESTNPVRNSVITTAISDISDTVNEISDKVDTNTDSISTITTNLNTKQDASEYYRKIYFGTDEVPSATLGEDGDVYIYIP